MAEHKTIMAYNGAIEIDFTPGNHSYKVNGERVVSVTSVLNVLNKPALISWAVRLMTEHLVEHLENGTTITQELIYQGAELHRVRKKEAADTGTLVHEWAEAYIKGLNPPMPTDERVNYGVIAFLNWVSTYDVRFVESERLVYSRQHNYVGTLDCIFTMGGEENHSIYHMGDFKTGGALYNEHRYQVAAYQHAYTEETGQVFGTKWLMRFAKEDKYKDGELVERAGTFETLEIPVSEQEHDFLAFYGALLIANRERELK